MKKINKFLATIISLLCMFSVVTPVLAEGEETGTTSSEEEVNTQADTGIQYKDGFNVLDDDSLCLLYPNNTYVLEKGREYTFTYKGKDSTNFGDYWEDNFEESGLFKFLGSDGGKEDGNNVAGAEFNTTQAGTATITVIPSVTRKFIVLDSNDYSALADKIKVAEEAVINQSVSETLTDEEIIAYLTDLARNALSNAGVDPDAYGIDLALISKTLPTSTTDGNAKFWMNIYTASGMAGADGDVDVTLKKVIEVVPNVTGDVPATSTSITDTTKLASTVYSNATQEQKEALDNGAEIKVDVNVNDTVSDSDKTSINNSLNGNTNVAVFINMEVFATIESTDDNGLTLAIGDKLKLGYTGAPVTVSVDVPENFIVAPEGYNRTYTVFRLHDGKVEELETSYDSTTGKITFVTDKFSTYAIAYSDTKKDSKTPATSDNNNIVMYSVLSGMAMIVGVGIVLFRKKNA